MRKIVVAVQSELLYISRDLKYVAIEELAFGLLVLVIYHLLISLPSVKECNFII